jgi:hydrogenase nickel incorporation protein HypA/HybF
MHESGIAYDLYMTARRAAVERNAGSVTKVSVGMGKLAMASPEQVRFLFEAFTAEDPLFTDTVLECTTIAPETRCACGYEGDELFVCPRCGAMPELVKGREIMVTSIQIEVEEE